MHTRHVKCCSLVRGLAILTFLLMLSVVANAYTVIMRGGKRIEIPAHFEVTNSTLTYEVSPGVQVTLATAAIDITATEKANNEAPGSFLRRVRSGLSQSDMTASAAVSTTPASTPVRTITNRDLESTAQRRRTSELAYETRRKQLGLPSAEESRRQAAAESATFARDLEQTQAAKNESEGYWRARASALRTEIAAIDAELQYVRRQLDEPVFSTSGGSFATVISGVPFVSFGSFGRPGHFGRGTFGRPVPHRTPVFGPPRNGLQPSAQIGFGRVITRERVFVNPLGFRRSHGGQFPLPVPNMIFGSTGNYDVSYDRNWLITHFNELAGARAGLNARWRELEDEARRAGAPPGWLRQ
ncbi:MAG TPA: hypothetical protein VMZ30_07695 [Pyrinomonadaceae bacterium]|nr:hypothetical protein [Pyrinomonadaceae bacterium]